VDGRKGRVRFIERRVKTKQQSKIIGRKKRRGKENKKVKEGRAERERKERRRTAGIEKTQEVRKRGMISMWCVISRASFTWP
jgi:hypothetical protein